MKSYWDTSAVINAALSMDVMERLEAGEHVTRLHTFAEFFSTMTGRGVPILDAHGNATRVRFSGDECAEWLRDFAGKVQIEDLTIGELLDGLRRAQKLNVQGGRVYDYWHALVSTKVKADELLTRNMDDFKGLTEKSAWP